MQSKRMLETVAAEFLNEEGWPKTSPLARKTVRSWMNNGDIEVLGATSLLLFDKEHWPRVTPPLALYDDVMCFRQKYYERCLRESAKGDTDWQWADEGWDLTHGIVYWLGDLLRDENIDPRLQVEMVRWLERMLREGHNDLLPIAVYDHLICDRKISRYFEVELDFRRGQIIRQSRRLRQTKPAFMIVTVPLAERAYPIHIRSGALSQLPDLPDAALPGEIALLSNSSVAPLYADKLVAQLEKLGQRVVRFDMNDGEQWKSLSTMEAAFDALAAARFSRRGCIWALGGGVTGDLSGFVAASWMRGVSWVQVPTTLLAMVDSSVGGKTGVNHPRAKNLLGAFWQPQAVIIDPDCLQTLPPRQVNAGLAEVIKYGVIADAEFFGWLEENLDDILALKADALTHIIARSCEIKALVVGQDERESDSVGRRAILNYGHTVGHALEAVGEYGALLHGEAIAIGMNVEARLAMQLGVISHGEGTDLLKRQSALFGRCDLPTSVPQELKWEELWAAMALDKKNRGASVNFILPKHLGEMVKIENVSEEAVQQAVVMSGEGIA